MTQVQCPNCSGYKVTAQTRPKHRDVYMILFLLGFATFGITWIAIFFMPNFFDEPTGEYSCDLCGLKFTP